MPGKAQVSEETKSSTLCWPISVQIISIIGKSSPTLEALMQVQFSLKGWRIISEKSFGNLELVFPGQYNGFSASIHGILLIP